MEGGIRARSESESSHRNFNHFSANPDSNSSDTNIVGMSDKMKHVEFEDTLEHHGLGASRSSERLMRSRYFSLIIIVTLKKRSKA